MAIKNLSAYELTQEREVSDLGSHGYLLRHKKSGAKVFILSNNDDNKVFYIGFRTPPKDSTGLPHILEHSVLCGSKNFPSKDPFIELAKGSLNTFLNAMTYPDKTVYPVASCNDQDFLNLMTVYLDAVFYPNIYKEQNIFKQEGWHLELEEPDGELIINGVVYNEMKGVYSSPDDVMEREILNALFPDNAYGKASGGDPDFIPTLSYEQFKEFHETYYHPSNAYIYLYGDMDIEKHLKLIDENYLSHFEYKDIDSAITNQQAFEKPAFVQKPYSITEDEDDKEATHLSLSYAIGSSLSKENYLTLQIINYALLLASGAVLKQALIDAGIGHEVFGSCEAGILQPSFSIVAKGADLEQKDEFLEIINTVLSDITKNGFNKRALTAAVNFCEFQYREADFGTIPKGLEWGLQALDSWLYDDNSPYTHIEALATFKDMKKKIDSNYFEDFIKENFLNNNHRAVVVITPEKGLSAKMDQKTADKLRAYKGGLTKAKIAEIVDETKALKKYQSNPSAKKDLEKIPQLLREDLGKAARPFVNELRQEGGVKILCHNIPTNGISYLKLVFNVSKVDESLMPYLGILPAVLGYVDTKNYGYAELFNEINIRSGGINANMNVYVDDTDSDLFTPCLEISIKALHSNLESAFEMVSEIVFGSKLDDAKRLLEIISEVKSMMQASFIQSGHSVAALRAMSYFSKSSAYGEIINGIPLFKLLTDLEKNWEDKKDGVIKNLEILCSEIFCAENLLVDYTASEDEYEPMPTIAKAFSEKLATGAILTNPVNLAPVKKNEGFYSSSKIQFVCRAGNFKKRGYEYSGVMNVAKVILGYDYLWNNVRVLGGAYGCMVSFGKSGDCYFVSYRDPNLKKTIEVYENAVGFFEAFEADERNMTKFIIGAISALDTPLTPAMRGARSLAAYMTRSSLETIQKIRDEVLSVTPEQIREMAGVIKAVMEDECLCVVGGEDKIKENRELFMSVEGMFTS